MATPFPGFQTAEIRSSLDAFFDELGKSPIMIGVAVLMINLGGRFIANDLTRYDEKVLNNKIVKKLTIFAIAFLSTRNVKFAILITFLYTILFSPYGLAYKIMVHTQKLLSSNIVTSQTKKIARTLKREEPKKMPKVKTNVIMIEHMKV
jgi:hypothetical protein